MVGGQLAIENLYWRKARISVSSVSSVVFLIGTTEDTEDPEK